MAAFFRPATVIRQRNPWMTLGTLVKLFALVGVGAWLGSVLGRATPGEASLGTLWGFAAGAGTYLVWHLIGRAVLLRHHRLGVRAMQRADHNAALAHFARSAALLAHLPWLHRWQWLVLGTDSAIPHHLMALYNPVVVHLRQGNPDAALAAFELLRAAYPHSSLTQAMAQTLAALSRPSGQAGAPGH